MHRIKILLLFFFFQQKVEKSKILPKGILNGTESIKIFYSRQKRLRILQTVQLQTDRESIRDRDFTAEFDFSNLHC